MFVLFGNGFISGRCVFIGFRNGFLLRGVSFTLVDIFLFISRDLENQGLSVASSFFISVWMIGKSLVVYLFVSLQFVLFGDPRWIHV